MSPQLRIALVVDPFRLRRSAGDHAPNVARELLSRGHLVRGFGSRPGDIPRSGPDPELAGPAGSDEGVGLRGFRPDVIVGYDPLSPAAWAAARAARALKVPLVLVEEGRTHRGGHLERGKRWFGKRLWASFVRRRAAYLVALDGAAEELARAQGFDAARITTLPSGVDLARYRPGLTSHLPARHGVRGRIVLCTQRLEEGAGLEELVHAFAHTVGRREDWSLVFAADGPAWPRLRSQADRLGIGASVHGIGTPRREELPGLFGACTLLAVPSLDDDFTGWRLRRALSSGLPVLAEDSPRARTWIEPDHCGLLVPRGAVAGWTEAIQRAAGSPERRKRWSRAARELAQQRFAWPDLASRFEQLLLAATLPVAEARATALQAGVTAPKP